MLALGTPMGPNLNETKFYRSEHYSAYYRFPSTSRIGCKIVTSLIYVYSVHKTRRMHAEVIRIRFVIVFFTAFVIAFNLITFLHLFAFVPVFDKRYKRLVTSFTLVEHIDKLESVVFALL